eukprot:4364732-Pyramimonas_sp.AAC.1
MQANARRRANRPPRRGGAGSPGAAAPGQRRAHARVISCVAMRIRSWAGSRYGEWFVFCDCHLVPLCGVATRCAFAAGVVPGAISGWWKLP